MTRGTRIGGLLAVAASAVTVVGLAATASAATAAHTPAAAHRLPLSASRLAADERSHQAASHQTTTITGLVRSAAGKPLTGVCVTAIGGGGHRSEFTGADGRYSISGLRAGQYSITYRPCGTANSYLSQTTARVQIGGQLIQPVAAVTLRTFAQQAEARMPARPATGPAALARRLLGLPKFTADSNASAAGHGRIAGKVTDQAGRPIKGVCVEAESRNGGYGDAVSTKNGSYRISKLPPGRYLVAFIPYCGSKGNWLIQFYRYSENPQKVKTVVVTAGRTTTGINAKLRPGGEISGEVTGQAGKKLTNICVQPVGTSRRRIYELAPNAVSEHGKYRLPNMPPGKYRLQFTPCGNNDQYLSVWWQNSATEFGAKVITVRAHHPVTGINQAMPLGGTITGTVTDEADTPLAGICVNAFLGKNEQNEVATTSTSTDGSYTLVGLPTGTYQVQVQTGCRNDGNYLSKSTPDNIAVTQGQTTAGVDIAMRTGAVISGTVTNSADQPVKGICVYVFGGLYGVNGGITRTSAAGTYEVPRLPRDSYTVQFAGGCGSTGSYSPQAWQDTNYDTPTPVLVATGQQVTGINATMQPGATIAGDIASATGIQLTNGCVEAGAGGELQGTGGEVYDAFASSRHGSYRMANLVPGQYNLLFADCSFRGPDYAEQWYRSKPGANGASAVWAGAGTTTSGVDAVLTAGGGFSGKMRTAAGHGVTATCLQATDLANGNQSPFFGYFNFGGGVGGYKLSALQPGRYRVIFQSGCTETNYATQWYRGSATERGATKVVVRANHITTGISSALVKGGTISGFVTSAATSAPVSNICVFAQDPSQYYFYGVGQTNKNGFYRIVGLNTGSYEVSFSPCNNGGAHNAADLVLSRMVHVRTGQPTTGIDASLTAGGTITGTVSGGSPVAGLPDICVDANGVNVAAAGFASTGADGSYEFQNLPPGNYRLSFYGEPYCDGAGLFAPKNYSGSVSVTAGATTSGVDVTLGDDGSISGTVTRTGGSKLAGVCVTAFGPSGPVVATTSAGDYTLGGLAPGRYRVQFSAGCGTSGLRTQWWQHAATRGGATVIHVTTGDSVTGINATMGLVR